MNLACTECAPVRRVYRVVGLDCVEDVRILQETIDRLDGVETLSFDLSRARMVVTFVEKAVPEARLLTAVQHAGMRAQPFSGAVNDRSARSVATLVAGGPPWCPYRKPKRDADLTRTPDDSAPVSPSCSLAGGRVHGSGGA